MGSTMSWSVWKGTRATKSVPADWEDVCEEAGMRFVHLANWYDIPANLIVNMDQQGVIVIIGNDKTYDKTGTKQVAIAARDEKRAYTLCVASSADGDILPFQQIWGGQSKESLPRLNADRQAAQKKGFDFTFAKSDKKRSHFSTLKTMIEVTFLIH
jgi:hypothetical protein